MRLWEHTPEELTAIPIPDLALLVLADFRDGDGWHKGNWVNTAKHSHPQHFGHANVGNRLWEAWAWLDAHAFVARRVDQDTPDARRLTEEGERALTLGLSRLHAAARLEVELRDELAKARRQFLAGDYEEAVFAAFRMVEERVRGLVGADDGDLGVRLMRTAFHPDHGPLTDADAEKGEQEAMGALFAGAIGAFKNPISHRTVNYDDPILAAEAVLLADLLLRLLDRSPALTEPSG
jgi:uncharacterized protein (TIGR02391 family)